MANNKFKKGDCVKLKTDGVNMRIENLNEKSAHCVWTYKKKREQVYLLSDLMHYKSHVGITIFRHKH